MKMKKKLVSMESGSEKYQFLVMLKGEKNERMNGRKKKASEGRCAFSDEKIYSWNETCRNFFMQKFSSRLATTEKSRLH